MYLDVLLLQAGGSPTTSFLFLGAMVLIFWFFIIRPQTKRQKEQNNFVQAMEKGDDVVTTSGILGKINKIEDDIITLEVGTKVYLRVTKSSISKEMTDALYAKTDKK
ncbi:MAG: preprotein translocase subunit YajC [Saprospiraceae bacterium]|nr:MAG: preprotein translocase subunit YajC [Saprospiraceae bacterium]